MGFADFYFQRFKIYNSRFPQQQVPPDLKMIVVIPSYREFRLFDTLECLSNCQCNERSEVLVVFNAPEGEDKSVLQMHHRQAQMVPQFSTKNLEFISIVEENLPSKIAGAGLARKLGMDAAIHRFNQINNKQGIILSLDADTLCQANYLSAVYNAFKNNPKSPGATIAFEHPIQGSDFPQEIYDAIVLYELFLRYYIQALRFIDFPYAYHTVGSAFAVKAWAYVQQGGMGLHQAGEDFYFLHKIIPLGNFFEIKQTKVFPSPRVSNRVPFGTGPVVREIISKKMKDYPTYPFEAFERLKPLFSQVTLLFTRDLKDLNLDPDLLEFLAQNDFNLHLNQMRQNSASEETFAKRFFAWFDALRVLKFLNFMIENKLRKQNVTQEARKLLKLMNINPGFSARALLEKYRQLQNT